MLVHGSLIATPNHLAIMADSASPASLLGVMSQMKTELVANGEMSEDVDVDKVHGANLDTFHALNDDTKPKPELPVGRRPRQTQMRMSNQILFR